MQNEFQKMKIQRQISFRQRSFSIKKYFDTGSKRNLFDGVNVSKKTESYFRRKLYAIPKFVRTPHLH